MDDCYHPGEILGVSETAREQLREKAPLIDPDELVDVFVSTLLQSDVGERARTAWFLGSFVNPEKDIDSGASPSDLDVFIEVPGWSGPPADSGMAMTAESVETPNVRIRNEDRWRGQFAPDAFWACTADEAWEVIPEYVKPLLVWASSRAVYVTREEAEAGTARPFDLTIGNAAQCEMHVEAKTGTCIWRRRTVESSR